MNFVRKCKTVFQQSMVISTGILIAITVESFIAHINGSEMSLDWRLLLSILVCSLASAIPTVFLICEEDVPARRYILRIVIHFLLVYAIVMGVGYLFTWFDTLRGYLVLSGVFVVVYCFVWAASLWTIKGEDKKINEALTQIRDNE